MAFKIDQIFSQAGGLKPLGCSVFKVFIQYVSVVRRFSLLTCCSGVTMMSSSKVSPWAFMCW